MLLIHEGRLTYEREGLSSLCDLGELWAAATGGLPLPLGANVIRRAMGPSRVAQVSRLVHSSIHWALANREETMQSLLDRDTRADLAIDRALLDRYLTMYANADTLAPPADVRLAIDELYRRAFAAGLLDRAISAEFAP